MRKVTKLWRCKDGRKVRICDMDDRHLANSIAMLERAAQVAKSQLPYPCFSGEMAQYYAEQDWERTMEAEPEYFFPIYEDLCREQDRRALAATK